MRFALTLALCGLWTACPKSFEAQNPPCDDNSGCTVEVLGNDFPDHVCGLDYTCVPKASVAAGADTGGAQTIYDAGLTSEDASEPECRRDSDCDPGEICQSGFCLPSGVPPRQDSGPAVDSGAAAPADAGVADPPDSGAPPTPDGGGGSGLPDIGGDPMLPDAEMPWLPDAE